MSTPNVRVVTDKDGTKKLPDIESPNDMQPGIDKTYNLATVSDVNDAIFFRYAGLLHGSDAINTINNRISFLLVQILRRSKAKKIAILAAGVPGAVGRAQCAIYSSVGTAPNEIPRVRLAQTISFVPLGNQINWNDLFPEVILDKGVYWLAFNCNDAGVNVSRPAYLMVKGITGNYPFTLGMPIITFAQTVNYTDIPCMVLLLEPA